MTAEPAGSVPSPAADTIIGLGGNDDIDGGGGADTISGGTGNDTITAAASGGTVHGDAGSDTITIRQTTDDVAGTFYGDADNDSMTFSTWSDSANRPVGTLAMHGGAGADRMTGTATISDDVTGLTINKHGENGDDRLEALRVSHFPTPILTKKAATTTCMAAPAMTHNGSWGRRTALSRLQTRVWIRSKPT